MSQTTATMMVDPERSRTMRAVKSRDTAPEMTVRRLIFSMGYRYRLHRKDLPGKPDLVFSTRRKVIFVHGCFWHGHDCQRGARVPKNNREYWERKIARNRERDSQHYADLERGGWTVLGLWECQIRETGVCAERIQEFLETDIDLKGCKNLQRHSLTGP
jgi:DNA mismatch endonuclease (patch repair protein)